MERLAIDSPPPLFSNLSHLSGFALSPLFLPTVCHEQNGSDRRVLLSCIRTMFQHPHSRTYSPMHATMTRPRLDSIDTAMLCISPCLFLSECRGLIPNLDKGYRHVSLGQATCALGLGDGEGAWCRMEIRAAAAAAAAARTA